MPSKKKSKRSKNPSNSTIGLADESVSTSIKITKSTNNTKLKENCNNNQLKNLTSKNKSKKTKNVKVSIQAENGQVSPQNSTIPEPILEELPSEVFYSSEVHRSSEPTPQQINDQTIRSFDITIAQIHTSLDEPSANGVLEVVPRSENNIAINCNGNTQNGNVDEESSDDDNHDDFFNEIFNSAPQQYISAPTDDFCSDDSDSELSTCDVEVKFFVDKSIRSKPVAEYDDTEYRIGYLDLTPDEYSCIGMITETTVEFPINSRHIVILDGTLNIKRINERHLYPQSNQCIELFEKLNLGRVQFSSTEPFLAKYEDEIYFVGDQLYDEYSNLLHRTKKSPGTSIRIRNDRLCIDLSTQTLDVEQTISFRNQNEICMISGSSDDNKYLDAYPSNGFRRVVLGNKPFQILEVEPELIHSSIHDDCTEIYAEADFPFGESEKVQKIVKDTAKAERQKQEELLDPDDEPLEMLMLKAYAVPKQIKEFAAKRQLSKKPLAKTEYGELLKKKSWRNDVKDYIKGYTMMLHFEEEDQARYLTRFNQRDIQITYHMERKFFFPVTEELTELAAAIEENVLDFLLLKPKSNSDKIIKGQVYRIIQKKIIIEIFPESFKLITKSWKNELYDISFILNRVPYQVQHYALQFIEKQNIFTKLINNSEYNSNYVQSPKSNRKAKKPEQMFKIEGTMLENLNPEQQSAVKSIVSKNDKLPYVLFGPPGTGKTRTLVAAIEQIVQTTKTNVLVCAMSNAACDEITERLVDVLKENELYRFYAKSYKFEQISPRIKRVSNFYNNRIFYPRLQYLYTFRVFVCTLCSAGCLTRARIDHDIWKPNHFGYVFIDEAASAHETMSLIPIAGLCTSKKKVHAKIVLAGDPKQLDAVTKSDAAKQMGFSTSWMEQLCNTNLYKRHQETGKFNELYISQLVQNYRSHPEILRIPNELFYENTLQASAKPEHINWYVNSKFLPSKQFPMIFKSVKGVCERSLEHSWYNETEIAEVVKTIKQLLPPYSKDKGLRQITQSDIGVVTPYRKQRHKISQKLRRLNFDEVTVGTAEVFQGKEKPVMIISTVRSNGDLGFVSEPRRLNVVITRAKCLVVIIGDPHTLKKDRNWLRVIEHCIKNKSFYQGEKVFSLR